MRANEELGIYICLPKDVFKYCHDLLEKIKATCPEANDIKSFFHITLYQGSFRYSDVVNIALKIKELIKSQKVIEISFKKQMNIVGKNIFLEVNKTQYIQDLHQKVVKEILPFKTGILRQFQKLNFDNLKENNTVHDIKVLGMANAYERYNPHVTVAYQIKETILPLELLEVQPIKFNLSSIGIGRIGFYGNVIEHLESFKLSEK